MKDEVLDVVNLNDEVVGQAKEEDIYAQLLPHRIVHVLIFNKKGEMALQLRSARKSYCPLHWVTSVSGHVLAGETYEQAALREMKEEIGVDLPLEMFKKDPYNDERNLPRFLVTFKATYDGPFTISPREVERMEFFSIGKILEMIQKGEKIHPQLLFLLQKHFVQ